VKAHAHLSPPPGDPAPPIEIELKLAVLAADESTVRQRLRRFARMSGTRTSRMRLETVYFDTPDGELAARQSALRVRQSKRRWVQTLKFGSAESALSARGEIELPLSASGATVPTPDPAALIAAGAPGWFAEVAPQAVVQRFRTAFERECAVIALPQGRVEIALDVGTIGAGGEALERHSPICEIEFELLDGHSKAITAAAGRLLGGEDEVRLALLPLPASKALRGERLARGEAPLAVQQASATRFSLAAEAASEGELLCRVAGSAADIVAANLQCLRSGYDSTAVHQARVGLRRLRSAVRLLAHAECWPASLTLQLSGLARTLGEARDLDVLLTTTWPRIERALAAHDSDGLLVDAAKALHARLEQRRQQAQQTACALATSPDVAAMLVDLYAFAATRSATGPRLTDKHARKLVLERIEGVLRRSRRFRKLDVAAQHRVRILAKRARYAVELLSARLPAKAARTLGKVLTTLQDRLGLLNDAEVALGLVLPMVDDAALARALIDWRMQLRDDYVDDVARDLGTLKNALDRLD